MVQNLELQKSYLIFKKSILIYRRLQWKNFEVLVTERKSIDVRDVLHEVQETLGGLLIIWGC